PVSSLPHRLTLCRLRRADASAEVVVPAGWCDLGTLWGPAHRSRRFYLERLLLSLLDVWRWLSDRCGKRGQAVACRGISCTLRSVWGEYATAACLRCST